MSDGFSLPPDPGGVAALGHGHGKGVVPETEAPSAGVAFAHAAALVSLSVAASAANGLVLVVFYRRPVLRSPSNRFVLSLVLANLVGALVVAPTLLAQLLLQQQQRPSTTTITSLRQWGAGLTTLCVSASVFSIVAIAVDRHSAVLTPLHYAMTITRRRSRVMICGAWLCAALLAAPPLAGVVPLQRSSPLSPTCTSSTGTTVTSTAGEALRLGYALTLVGVGFTLPLCALCWIYARMYSAAHRNSERTRRHSVSLDLPQPPSQPQEDTSVTTVDVTQTRRKHAPPLGQLSSTGSGGGRRRCSNASLFFREEGRAVKTAAMVVASFLLCWTLFFATALADAWAASGAGAVPELCRRLSELLALSSGCVTPAIYVFRNETAKAEAVRLLLWWRRESHPQTTTTDRVAAKTPAESQQHADSVSVQSFQLPPPPECRHCLVTPAAPATADFVATYEVVESAAPRTSRRESVTFRLAFLPASARRCQACVRQNSDSSSGSGHPLLPPSRDSSSAEANNNASSASVERQDSDTSASAASAIRQDSARSDVTVDSGVVPDMYAAAPSSNPQRHKLRRLAAVEDEDSPPPPPHSRLQRDF